MLRCIRNILFLQAVLIILLYLLIGERKLDCQALLKSKYCLWVAAAVYHAREKSSKKSVKT